MLSAKPLNIDEYECGELGHLYQLIAGERTWSFTGSEHHLECDGKRYHGAPVREAHPTEHEEARGAQFVLVLPGAHALVQTLELHERPATTRVVLTLQRGALDRDHLAWDVALHRHAERSIDPPVLQVLTVRLAAFGHATERTDAPPAWLQLLDIQHDEDEARLLFISAAALLQRPLGGQRSRLRTTQPFSRPV